MPKEKTGLAEKVSATLRSIVGNSSTKRNGPCAGATRGPHFLAGTISGFVLKFPVLRWS
jgi:hypothetical protein